MESEDLSKAARVVTELLGVRVEVTIERWIHEGPLFGPWTSTDTSYTKTGRIVTVGIGDENKIIVQLEEDDGYMYTYTASRVRRIAS